MTLEEEKEVIRVCGKDYDYWDIPTYIRKRDEANAQDTLENDARQERCKFCKADLKEYGDHDGLCNQCYDYEKSKNS